MKVELIIPKFDNDGSNNKNEIDAAIRSFCKLFGGVTVYDAQGYWVNESGRLFEDSNVVLVAAGAEHSNASAARQIAQDILKNTDQEAVCFSIGNITEIIE